MQKAGPKKPIRKPQHQSRPGKEYLMQPVPVTDSNEAKHAKLRGKVALITGGDSGIGKAVATLFAREGSNIAIAYLNEHKDAKETKMHIESTYNVECILLPGDLSKEKTCISVVDKTVKYFGQIDILVNNLAIHYEQKSLLDISAKQLKQTFATNIFSYFYTTKAALKYMKRGATIVNSSSVTAYRGSPSLIDYASTKAAIIGFTRSLSSSLVEKGIRVNAVAPGPIWTPLIASSFKPSKVAKHGSDSPMKRAGEPVEIAPSYLFLASDDSSYMTGQVLHPNGGEIVNG